MYRFDNFEMAHKKIADIDNETADSEKIMIDFFEYRSTQFANNNEPILVEKIPQLTINADPPGWNKSNFRNHTGRNGNNNAWQKLDKNRIK